MDNNIKIFENPKFGKVRTTLSTSNEPLFCLADVCKALGLQQGDVNQRLDKGVVLTQPLSTAGGMQMANFVNEDGLYDVIFDSRKPEAKAFRKWVTSEVLPSIRKTGGYIVSKEEYSPEDIMARAFAIAQETIKRKSERIAKLQHNKEKLERQIEADKPLTALGDAVEKYSDDIKLTLLANILTQNKINLGRNKLRRWLRDNGYILQTGAPTQKSMSLGVMAMSERECETRFGCHKIYAIPLVTAKGRTCFINKLLEELGR